MHGVFAVNSNQIYALFIIVEFCSTLPNSRLLVYTLIPVGPTCSYQKCQANRDISALQSVVIGAKDSNVHPLVALILQRPLATMLNSLCQIMTIMCTSMM